MKAYVEAVEIKVYDYHSDWQAGRIRVSGDGESADVQTVGVTRKAETTEQLRAECIAAGLVEWAEVGPPGGRDSVLVPTAHLLAQLAPVYGRAIELGEAD